MSSENINQNLYAATSEKQSRRCRSHSHPSFAKTKSDIFLEPSTEITLVPIFYKIKSDIFRNLRSFLLSRKNHRKAAGPDLIFRTLDRSRKSVDLRGASRLLSLLSHKFVKIYQRPQGHLLSAQGHACIFCFRRPRPPLADPRCSCRAISGPPILRLPAGRGGRRERKKPVIAAPTITHIKFDSDGGDGKGLSGWEEYRSAATPPRAPSTSFSL